MEDFIADRRSRSEFVSRLTSTIELQFLSDQSGVAPKLRALVSSGAIRYWLSNFLDVVVARWELCESISDADRASVLENPLIPNRARPLVRMTDLLSSSQTLHWNNVICKQIVSYWNKYGHATLNFTETYGPVPLARAPKNVLSAKGGKICVSSTYLGKIPELLLALMCGSIPLRWKEPEILDEIDWNYRDQMLLRTPTSEPGNFETFVCEIIPQYLPQSFVEHLDQLETWGNNRFLRTPSVLFTANLHLSSDSFLVWAGLHRLRGMKLLVGQHGGLSGQGAIATRGEEFEQHFFDAYLNWGWSTHSLAATIPVQLTVWKKRRHSSNHRRTLLFITDCTFRYSRRPWASTSDNDEYKRMIVETFEAMPEEIQRVTTVRLHHDHNKYDVNHENIWAAKIPQNQVDNGLKSIEKLRRHARLVVCTTLGTSEIIQFSLSIPTVLRLHPAIHAVRESCEDLFASMVDVGLVHYSEESLRRFLDANWNNIDYWWKSESVQGVVLKYLKSFGHKSNRPLRDIKGILTSFVATNTRDAADPVT